MRNDAISGSGRAARLAGGRSGHGVILAALLALAIAVYARVAGYPFLDLDDGQYVTANAHVKAGLTWEGFRWAIAATDAANWHPLTWISHQADVTLFGLSPGSHHVVNLLLHLANVVLMYAVFAAMTGCRWRSAFVAAVFALHPLHVESVAWISERKDLLSTLFALASVAAYVRYARTPTPRALLPVAALFAMALLSKPMPVTLPFVLLLLDYWPLGRFAGGAAPGAAGSPPAAARAAPGRLVLEKVPLIALSAASCAITVFAQDKGGGVVPADVLAFPARAANAVAAYAAYVLKTAWPYPLAVFYPHPWDRLPAGTLIASLAFLVLVTAAVLRARRSRPALAVGWFWYLGTLVPVIGLVQVGWQGMADRYTYLPQTGLAIMIAYGAFHPAPRWARRAVLVPVASALVLAMSVATWLQVGVWRSDASLFSHAVRHTRDNFFAYDALGKSAWHAGRPDEAIGYLREALRIRPSYTPARYNLGVIYADVGRTADAIAEYREALRLRPDFADAWTNLAGLHYARGELDDALRCGREALRFNPGDAVAHNTIGAVFARRGMRADAIVHFREALQLDPGYAEAAGNLRHLIGE